MQNYKKYSIPTKIFSRHTSDIHIFLTSSTHVPLHIKNFSYLCILVIVMFITHIQLYTNNLNNVKRKQSHSRRTRFPQ